MRISKLLIIAVYRPPQGHKNKFLDTLLETTSSNTACVVMGDTNIDFISADPYAKKSELVFSTYGITNFITKPTRITTHSATVLDICASNVNPCKSKTWILSYDLSDHLPVLFASFAPEKNSQPTKQLTTERLINDETRETFFHIVKEIDWQDVYYKENVNDAYGTFIKLLRAVGIMETDNSARPEARPET